MSKNKLTIEHLKLACRHVQELMAAGVTENLAIRTLELFADVYAKVYNGGTPAPHHVAQVPRSQWSVAAKKFVEESTLPVKCEYFDRFARTLNICAAKAIVLPN